MACNFPNQITNRNFLSPVGFKFTLAKEPKVAFFCNSARIPEISLSVLQQPTYLKDLDVPGGKLQYGDLTLRFIVDEDMENYLEVWNWLNQFGFPRDWGQYQQLLNEDENSKGKQTSISGMSDGTLLVYDSNYNVNLKVNYKDLFPVSLSSIQFDTTPTEINYASAQVVFKYTIYDIIKVSD